MSAHKSRTLVSRILGPWPLFPGGTLATMTVFLWMQNLYIALFVPEYANCRLSCVRLPTGLFPGVLEGVNALEDKKPVDFIGLMLNGFIAASAGALVLLLGKRMLSLRFFDRPRATSYTFFVSLAAVSLTLTRLNVFAPQPEFPEPRAVITNCIRVIVVLLIVHSLLGRFAERYENARLSAETALQEVRRQQALVIDADEKSRREVATFLHDRVQAGLLVIAMRLRAAANNLETHNEALETAIKELEQLRSDDVRGASRRLSPDFASVGLDAALADLAASWKEAMSVSIHFDGEAHARLHEEPDNRYVTAIYRIVEQALLNAAAHGKATVVEISVICNSHLQVTVSDNGAGLPDSYEPGAGSAIIDAWVSSLRGSWSLEANDQRTLLQAQWPTMT